MSPCCDLDLENSKPIFFHDTLAHDDASLSTNTDILTLHCDPDHATNNPFFFSQDTLAYDDVSSHSSVVAEESTVQRINSSEEIIEIVTF